jgi:hypothetical protein
MTFSKSFEYNHQILSPAAKIPFGEGEVQDPISVSALPSLSSNANFQFSQCRNGEKKETDSLADERRNDLNRAYFLKVSSKNG